MASNQLTSIFATISFKSFHYKLLCNFTLLTFLTLSTFDIFFFNLLSVSYTTHIKIYFSSVPSGHFSSMVTQRAIIIISSRSTGRNNARGSQQTALTVPSTPVMCTLRKLCVIHLRQIGNTFLLNCWSLMLLLADIIIELGSVKPIGIWIFIHTHIQLHACLLWSQAETIINC